MGKINVSNDDELQLHKVTFPNVLTPNISQNFRLFYHIDNFYVRG